MQTTSSIGAFAVAVTRGEDTIATSRFHGVASPIGDFAMQGGVASQTGEFQAQGTGFSAFLGFLVGRLFQLAGAVIEHKIEGDKGITSKDTSMNLLKNRKMSSSN